MYCGVCRCDVGLFIKGEKVATNCGFLKIARVDFTGDGRENLRRLGYPLVGRILLCNIRLRGQGYSGFGEGLREGLEYEQIRCEKLNFRGY